MNFYDTSKENFFKNGMNCKESTNGMRPCSDIISLYSTFNLNSLKSLYLSPFERDLQCLSVML